jgi:hypothetical protein
MTTLLSWLQSTERKGASSTLKNWKTSEKKQQQL